MSVFAFEMFLDLFQGFALRLRQEERSGDEIDHGAAREDEEHGGVAVLADRRQNNAAMVVETQ